MWDLFVQYLCNRYIDNRYCSLSLGHRWFIASVFCYFPACVEKWRGQKTFNPINSRMNFFQYSFCFPRLRPSSRDRREHVNLDGFPQGIKCFFFLIKKSFIDNQTEYRHIIINITCFAYNTLDYNLQTSCYSCFVLFCFVLAFHER